MRNRGNTVGSHKTAIYTDSNGDLCVKYHATTVWRKSQTGKVTLNNGGWQTRTTATRINQAFRQFTDWPINVCQRKGEWLVESYNDTAVPGYFASSVPYSNGMTIGG